MAGRIIPETANRTDWPRLVAQSHKDHEKRLAALEAGGGGGGGVSDGDKGDVVVSGGGTVWTVENKPIYGTSTVTVAAGRIEWSEAVTATGVTGASRIIASLAPATDADENVPAMLGLGALAGLPGTDQITFTLAFAEPVAGAVKINWSAF